MRTSFCDLALHEARHGDAGPAADHLGDVLVVDLLLQHLPVALELGQRLVALLDLALEVGDLAVADLRRPARSPSRSTALGLALARLELLLQRRGSAAIASFSACQWAVIASASSLQVGELLLDLSSRSAETASVSFARATRSISSWRIRRVDDVDLGGHRVDLDAEPAGGLVDEVDRLVGQEAAGHVAVGQHRGGDEGGVLDAHAVVDLVALLQAAQDGDRVLDAWAGRRTPAGSGARGRRPSRCACGTHGPSPTRCRPPRRRRSSRRRRC